MASVVIDNLLYNLNLGSSNIEYSNLGNQSVGYSMYGADILTTPYPSHSVNKVNF